MQKAENSTARKQPHTRGRAPEEPIMWWIVALLLVFLALDVIVKSNGTSA